MTQEGGVAESLAEKSIGRRASVWDDLIERLDLARLGGLRFGESEAVMARLLHLFTIDFRNTPWFRQGQPPPAVDLPPNIRMRWLSPEEWRTNPRIVETAPDIAAARFRTGGHCLIGWDSEAKRTAYQLWVTESGAYIPWIFRYVAAPPDQLLVTDAWVHPDYRGGNLHWAGASEAFAEAVRRGRQYIYAGMEEVEFFPFATKIARLGFGVATPKASIVGIKLFSLSAHFEKAPSPGLVAFCDRLRARYGTATSLAEASHSRQA